MSHYEKLSLILTFLAICAAVYIGLLQSSINRNLLNLNYEPSLAISYSKPPSKLLNGLSITNNAKSSIYFYESVVITDLIPENKIVINNNNPSTISPGQTTELLGEDIIPALTSNMGTSTDKTFLLDIFFETQDRTKYILRTSIRLIPDSNGLGVLFGPVSYTAYNWPQK